MPADRQKRSTDGVNDYVTVSNIFGVNNFNSTLKFSIEFWCKVNSNTGDFTFVNKGGGGNEQCSIDIFSTNLRFYVKSGTGIFTHIQAPRITTAEGGFISRLLFIIQIM